MTHERDCKHSTLKAIIYYNFFLTVECLQSRQMLIQRIKKNMRSQLKTRCHRRHFPGSTPKQWQVHLSFSRVLLTCLRYQ